MRGAAGQDDDGARRVRGQLSLVELLTQPDVTGGGAAQDPAADAQAAQEFLPLRPLAHVLAVLLAGGITLDTVSPIRSGTRLSPWEPQFPHSWPALALYGSAGLTLIAIIKIVSTGPVGSHERTGGAGPGE